MPRLMVRFSTAIVAFILLTASYSWADEGFTPPEMLVMQEIEADKSKFEGGAESEFAMQIRKEAQREAALSYGARGGLAKRTYEIRQELAKKETYLDRIYDFRRLLIVAPSGLLIEPPIIDESINALEVVQNGQEAAVADRILAIDVPAKIVTAPRNWRTYLEREWGTVEPPPDVVLPQNHEERQNWRKWVRQGWEEGYQQAEEIFQTDLDRLVADLQGMIRYRLLLAQGMVSQPYALQEDRGITGGGDMVRIGDRSVKITGPSQLTVGGELWQPANR